MVPVKSKTFPTFKTEFPLEANIDNTRGMRDDEIRKEMRIMLSTNAYLVNATPNWNKFVWTRGGGAAWGQVWCRRAPKAVLYNRRGRYL